jgi:hypothetical protein
MQKKLQAVYSNELILRSMTWHNVADGASLTSATHASPLTAPLLALVLLLLFGAQVKQAFATSLRRAASAITAASAAAAVESLLALLPLLVRSGRLRSVSRAAVAAAAPAAAALLRTASLGFAGAAARASTASGRGHAYCR